MLLGGGGVGHKSPPTRSPIPPPNRANGPTDHQKKRAVANTGGAFRREPATVGWYCLTRQTIGAAAEVTEGPVEGEPGERDVALEGVPTQTVAGLVELSRGGGVPYALCLEFESSPLFRFGR